MTTKDDVLRLFGVHPETTRIGAYGQGATILHDRGKSTAIALTVELLEQDSKQPSGKWLSLQVRPEDAMILAKTILEIAQERDWDMSDVKIVRSSFPSGETKH